MIQVGFVSFCFSEPREMMQPHTGIPDGVQSEQRGKCSHRE